MSRTSHQRSILRYAEDLRRWEWPPNDQPVSDVDNRPVVETGPLREAIRAVVPSAAIPIAQMACTRAVMPLTARRMEKLRVSGRDLQVQFACGSRVLPGWINIDLLGSGADFHWDLRRPVPLPDGSVSTIYHEHFLEHLPFQAALGTFREAWRLLKPGGVLRFGVPDFGRYCRSYVTDDGFLEQLKPERPTPCLAVNELLYWYGHRSMWDAETLLALVEEIGFVDVTERSFGESAIDPCPDWQLHELETVYIEARRS